MTIGDILKGCEGMSFGLHNTAGIPDDIIKATDFQGAVIDSRKVEKGNLFFAIKGENTDGHKYINKAFESGAAAVIAEHLPEGEEPKGPVVLVEDTQKALAQIAAAYRKTLDIPIIGITGSVGKTTAKEMTAAVLSEKFCVQKTAGNFNNELGMPLTLLSIGPEHQAAVVEMGINHFGEMDRMAQVARPDIFVITNIGPCHLEFLGDLHGVLKAKTEGLKYMADGAPLIINADDEELYSLKSGGAPGEDLAGKTSPVFFALDRRQDAAFYAENLKSFGAEGMSFTLCETSGDTGEGERLDNVRIQLSGSHMVYNALAAACVGKVLGMELSDIAAGLSKANTVAGHGTFEKAGNITLINDCYNANPASMKASLKVLSECEGYRIAVLGDMGELGADEISLHEEVGEYAAGFDIDAVFMSGELCAHMAEAFRRKNKGNNLVYEKDKESIIRRLTELINSKKNDPLTVLVKASHFMGFDTVVKEILI